MLRILILKDERGLPIVDQKEVERWVEVANSVFKERCNVELIRPRLSDDAARKNVDVGLETSLRLSRFSRQPRLPARRRFRLKRLRQGTESLTTL